MQPDSLVSIVINNYNYERYVGEAIDSALNQTYPHVEVIVVIVSTVAGRNAPTWARLGEPARPGPGSSRVVRLATPEPFRGSPGPG